MTGPRWQNPWHPVLTISSSTPFAAASSSNFLTSLFDPDAWHAVPQQTRTRWVSFSERSFFSRARSASSSPTLFRRLNVSSMFAPCGRDDIVHHPGRQLPVQVLVVHGGNGRERATPHAAHGFERDRQILGRLAFLDPQFVLHLGQHGLGPAHVARGAHADLDHVLAARLEMEIFVERGNA